jgi:hypothetical protein
MVMAVFVVMIMPVVRAGMRDVAMITVRVVCGVMVWMAAWSAMHVLLQGCAAEHPSSGQLESTGCCSLV